MSLFNVGDVVQSNALHVTGTIESVDQQIGAFSFIIEYKVKWNYPLNQTLTHYEDDIKTEWKLVQSHSQNNYVGIHNSINMIDPDLQVEKEKEGYYSQSQVNNFHLHEWREYNSGFTRYMYCAKDGCKETKPCED